MMVMSKIMVGVTVFWLFLMMGVFIAIGCIVYKDAKAHGLKAWMWAAIAVFIPNFIGLIIYLVVRNDAEKEGECSKCGTRVLSNYNICPGCRSTFERMCEHCNNVIKEEISICPYCGESINDLEITPTAQKVYKKTKIARPLGIILGIFFLSFILVMGIMITKTMPNAAVMNIETNLGDIYKSSFYFKRGKEFKHFTLEEGKDLGIKGHVKVDKGSIEVTVKDEEGKLIHTETFENIEKDIRIPQEIEGSKKYEVTIVFNKAKGNIQIEPM